MIVVYPFPYKQIKKGSKIILYGAGENGLEVFRHIRDTAWCRILDVVDKNHANIVDFPVRVASPESLRGRNDYDYVLVTIIAKTIAEPVKRYLVSIGVQEKKIFLAYRYFAYMPEYTKLELLDRQYNARLKIVMYLMGAMGDCVIALKAYEEIVKLAPDSMIDIFSEGQWFVDHVFFELPNLGRVIEEKFPKSSVWDEYDVILTLRFTPHLVKVNLNKVQQSALNLAERLALLKEHEDKNFVDLHMFQYANRILLDRAKFLGLNRYSLLGYGGLFEINDKKVNLRIAAGADKQFQKLKLKRPYITFNYGAGDALRDGKPQTKQWLPDYHAELNKMLKQAYPDIEIVQLGASDVTIVDGADRYVLGEDLEVSKCVLKHALCHFDCEGGLVHIATQLGTKCFVVFGPTPIWFMGYEENTNIAPEICGECKGLIPDWYTRCFRGYSPPACMSSIKPERVFELMSAYIEEHIGEYKNDQSI